MDDLKRGTRFRAFPTRTVRQADGTYTVPVYRVTSVRRVAGNITVFYRVDDEGGAAQWYTSIERLEGAGLEILP